MGIRSQLQHWQGRGRDLIEAAFPPMSPGAICIGAQKAGTTAIYRYLREHPGVAVPKIKEINFFNCNTRYERGIAAYHAEFPRRTPARWGKLTIDVTPGYLGGAERAAERIRGYNSAIKLIALLRHPAHRAHSAWQMYRAKRGTPDWFAAWMRECDRTLPPEFFVQRPPEFGESFVRDLADELAAMDQDRIIAMPVLRLGMYGTLLRHYYDRFPREQILCLASEDMRADTPGAMRRIEDHLGLSHHIWSSNNTRPVFVGDYGEGIEPEALRLLDTFYRDENRMLYDLVQHDFGWG